METKNIIKILKEGGIGVMLTDTIYGIVGSAFSKKAVEHIFKVKGRDSSKPFIVLISAPAEIEKFGIKCVPKTVLEKYWPGKVSIVLPCKSNKFKYLHRGKKTLAFRLPEKQSLIEILKKTGPLVAPSANPSGLPPAENITQARKYFRDTVDFYVADRTKIGKPSKVILMTSGSPKVLRK